MFHTRSSSYELIRHAGPSYLPLAFIARLPFAMMTVGVLTLVVAERGSVTLGGLNSAAAGIGTALAGPLLGAAADRLGQRRVLVPVGLVNAALLGGFVLVVASDVPDLPLLAMSVLIGASAPQIAPMSRTAWSHSSSARSGRPPRNARSARPWPTSRPPTRPSSSSAPSSSDSSPPPSPRGWPSPAPRC